MTIHHTARHQVKAPEAGKVKAAIVAFVETSRTSRQQDAHRVAAEDDPTKFVRLFEFADRSAHQAHGTPDAVRKSKPPVGGARRTLRSAHRNMPPPG